MTIKVSRKEKMVEKVVFVGGLPGCGKSLLTPIIGGLERVEIQKYNYGIEHICSLYFLGKVDLETAGILIRLQTDLDLYHMMMGRETNFRFKDLSSIFKNPGPWRYIKRLFKAGDAEALERIRKERPILQTLIHNALIHSVPLAHAMGESFTLIEGVRHPLYMIKQWYLYMDRYGNCPRDFTLCYDYKGHILPFFALGWEELYLSLNTMDRVIYSVDRSLKMSEEAFQKLSPEQRSRVLMIPFEGFVVNPWPFLKRLENILGTKTTRLTLKEMKHQNVPREMFADGIGLLIHKQYGWEPPEKNSNEAMEFEKRRRFAEERATPAGMELLDRLCKEYESRYMSAEVLNRENNENPFGKRVTAN